MSLARSETGHESSRCIVLDGQWLHLAEQRIEPATWSAAQRGMNAALAAPSDSDAHAPLPRR